MTRALPGLTPTHHDPQTHAALAAGERLQVRTGVLRWQLPPGWQAVSSAVVGGGLSQPSWVLNVGVDQEFDRHDLPTWADEVSAALRLSGAGVTLLTAADVAQVEYAQIDGVQVWATVGVTRPTWPVRPEMPPLKEGASQDAITADAITAGTINIVACLPVPLTQSALVQAVGTITEAKAQALVQAGVPGTGTASDALAVLSPPVGAAAQPAEIVHFAGVRSQWGQVLAAAVHQVVNAGLAAHPWPSPDVDPAVIW